VASNESGDRPTLEPPTPAELLSELVSKIKKQDASIGLPGFLANAYLDWSSSLVVAGGYDRGKTPLSDIERPLFSFFCAQLRNANIEIPPPEETLVFTEMMLRLHSKF